MKRIKLLNCTQVRSDLPIFEGRCSDNGGLIQVVEFGTAREACRVFYNDGLKKGIILGTVATLVGIATAFTIGRIVAPDQKDKED